MTQRTSESRAAVQELLRESPVAYYRVFAAIGGGVTSGVFLSQLFYWHDRTSDPEGWIYKTQAEWQEETGLTRREQETARRNLRERGILDEKLARVPARLHYRLRVDRVLELLAEYHRARCEPPRHRGHRVSVPSARPSDQGHRPQPEETKLGEAPRPAHRPSPDGSTSPDGPLPTQQQAGPDAARRSEPSRQATGAASAGPPGPNPPDQSARSRHTSQAKSAHHVGPNPPDQSAQSRQTSLAETANQVRSNPPDKPGGIRHTRLAETAAHAETTRDYATDYVRESGTEYNTRTKEAAASPMTALCSIHGATMTLRHRDGDTWYSHRLPNGTWCKGGPGDQPSNSPDPQSAAWRRGYATQFADLGIPLPTRNPEQAAACPSEPEDGREHHRPPAGPSTPLDHASGTDPPERGEDPARGKDRARGAD